MSEKRYIMRCKRCGGTKFSFRWEFHSELEEKMAMFGHSGVGLQLENAIVRCETCGAEAPYEEEDFIEIIEEGKE